MKVQRRTLKELEQFIKEGKAFNLFKPFFYKGQILINVEKLLTLNDLSKLEGKIFGPIEVVETVEHDADHNIRKIVVDNILKILKSSKRFVVDEVHHLDVKKRKECENIIVGIIKNKPHLAQLLVKLYKFSKKYFVHSVHVGIISIIIDLGMQEKRKFHDGLRSETLLTASLLHDIGILEFPAGFFDKKILDMNEKEMHLYQKYPIASSKIALKYGGNLRKETVKIILQHKERLTGDGFPYQFKKDDIEETALIVGLADEFDLLLMGELSNTKREPSEIMSRLSKMSKVYGSDVVDSFYTWFRYLK